MKNPIKRWEMVENGADQRELWEEDCVSVMDVELLVLGEALFNKLLFLRVASEGDTAAEAEAVAEAEAEVDMVLMVVPKYEERRSDRNVGPERVN